MNQAQTRILILGAAGQLGSQLQRLFPDAVGLTRLQFDLGQSELPVAKLLVSQPEWIINCAAYNQVDHAESDPQTAFQINALAPRTLAQFAKSQQIRLIHISSDFVFGQEILPQRPRIETDPVGPVSVYGMSKLAGEQFVRSESPESLVIRTCGLYGNGGTSNFVKTMLKLGRSGRELNVVDDQVCCPTSIVDLADAIASLIRNHASGLYHIVNSGQTTWYQFARRIFEIAEIPAKLNPTSSTEYAAAARRPAYSVLDCTKYEQFMGRKLRSIDHALTDFLND